IQEKLQEGLATPAPAEGMTRLYRTERPSGEGPYGYSVHAGRLRDRGAPPGTHFTDKESAAKEWRRAFPVTSTAEQRALYNAYNEDYDKYRTLYTRAVAAGDTEKAKELKKLRDEAYDKLKKMETERYEGRPGTQLSYIDMPTAEAEKYRITQPGAGASKTTGHPMGEDLVEGASEYELPHSLGFRRAKLDEAGKLNTELAFLISRVALGAAAGAYTGDTTEEKVRNGLIAAGLGEAAG